jgi:hypothetical protein
MGAFSSGQGWWGWLEPATVEASHPMPVAMESNPVLAQPSNLLHRIAEAEIPFVFRMVEWAIVVGVMRYLGEHFNLQVAHVLALILSTFMLVQVCLARRTIALKGLFLLVASALIALAWEMASVIATLHASVIID